MSDHTGCRGAYEHEKAEQTLAALVEGVKGLASSLEREGVREKRRGSNTGGARLIYAAERIRRDVLGREGSK